MLQQRSKVDRIPYIDAIPGGFFTIPDQVYDRLEFRPAENKETTSAVFADESGRNEIIFYTNHENIRLTGIFPHDSPVAYFGFWETTNDLQLNEVAFQLLETDAKRLKRSKIIGPINFNTYQQYRLRSGEMPSWKMFDREPVNPDYYNELLTKLNFIVKDSFESRLIKKENIEDFYVSKEVLLDQIDQLPYNFIKLTADNWSAYEEQIFEITTAIFEANPLYKKISFEQFRLLYNKDFAQKLCPHSSVLFQDRSSGQLAAISLCLPNYAALSNMKKPISFRKDFTKLPEKILLAKTVGVHPKYRNNGLMNFLGIYGMLSFKKYYDEVIFCLMRTGNHSMHFSDPFKYEKAEYYLYGKEVR